jgi:hypothetical protein
MQPIFSLKKHFCEHYAANSLFYKNPSVLLTFGHFSGQKKMSISEKFSDFIFFFFSLRKFL